MPLNQQELEKLGRDISHKCKWAGDDILTVFQSALEDANFHSFNRLVGELWEREIGITLAPCGCETRSSTDLSVGWHRCGSDNDE
tara:strand:+ start:364 stop:618 length:255 start_codon:yes stop_codon:yes gene_type:complete